MITEFHGGTFNADFISGSISQSQNPYTMTFTSQNTSLPQELVGSWQLTNDDNSVPHSGISKNMPTALQLNSDGTGIWQEGVSMRSVYWLGDSAILAIIANDSFYTYLIEESTSTTLAFYVAGGFAQNSQIFYYVRD